MIWKYDMNGWKKVMYQEVGMTEQDEGDDFHDWLNKNGFNDNPTDKEGHDCGFNFSVYCKLCDSEDQEKWIIDCSFSSDVNLVYIENLPSFLSFMKEYRDVFKTRSDFVMTEDYDFIRKDTVDRLYRRGNKEEARLYAEVGEKTYCLQKHNHRFVQQYLIDHFNIH